MKLKELSFLLKSSAVQGANKVLEEHGVLKARLTKSEAFHLFGRFNVERWLREGLISPIRFEGKISKDFIERNSLERIARSSNRITYQPMADR